MTRGRFRYRIDMPNRLDISNRVAVVIGATSGIGRALAFGLAEHGATVVPTGRRVDRLDEVCRELEALGTKTLCKTADVNSRSSIDSFRDAVLERFGRVDVVCLNAGVSLRGRAWEFSVDDWR